MTKPTAVSLQKNLRVSQGDIYKEVEFIEYVEEKEGNIVVSKIVFPLVVVLTQDCDLAQDFTFRHPNLNPQPNVNAPKTQDKFLISVLVAPLYNAEFVYSGEHLSELNLLMESINAKKSPGDFLRKNERSRYHYLEFPHGIPIPPSIIDFKHYFSVNVEYLRTVKSNDFVCRVSELFREDISQRFSSFLSRIGLP